ncbi:Endoglucanase V-like protein [Mycena chlorophos]|uniref:Endoglucanase V-like protein n=1 Tax=Mycena chlorophos TaxID=658473 RepID=A0A8H6RXC7_MYCCL|nr:Endoglucanase V-like protein [Mycena chlorophos]
MLLQILALVPSVFAATGGYVQCVAVCRRIFFVLRFPKFKRALFKTNVSLSVSGKSFFAMLLQILALVPPAFAAAGGYVQVPGPSTASFTMYSGCQMPACGVTASGYTAAISQLAFGSVPGLGPGDACGRCFSITGTADPYSPSYTGPFGATIVVKVCLLYGLSSKGPDLFQVTDMCPAAGNEQWCGQTAVNGTNSFGKPVQYAPVSRLWIPFELTGDHAHSFDLCEDSGASGVFFPSGHGALTGTWEEVSCSQWLGSGDGPSEFTGACLIGDQAPLWPSTGCGNQGLAPGATGKHPGIDCIKGRDINWVHGLDERNIDQHNHWSNADTIWSVRRDWLGRRDGLRVA